MTTKSNKGAASADTETSLDDTANDLPAPSAAAAAGGVVLKPGVGASHHGFSGVKVRVKVHSGAEDGGKEAVSVGLNDYHAQIPRDVEVLLPKEVFKSCIEDAVTDTFVRGKDGIETHRVARFAYSLLGEVQPEAQAA